MEELVPSGPGSIRIAIEEGDDWVPAEASMYFEETGYDEQGTETIAVLDLDASEIGGDGVQLAQRIQIELTLGDLINVRDRLTKAITEAESYE